MEKNDNDMVMKSRSVSGAITEGFRLYMDNFKRIFRFSWPGALVFAIATGAFNTYAVTELPRLELLLSSGRLTLSQQLAVLGQSYILGVFGLAILLASLLFGSYGFSLLRQHLATGAIAWPQRWFNFDGATLWRTVKCYLCLFVVSLGFSIVLSLFAFLAATVLRGIVGIAFFMLAMLAVVVLFMPLSYVCMRYMLTDGTGFWQQLGRGYSIGLRHLGFIFAILLVELAAVALINFIVSIPSFILFSANMLAQAGAISGDALGMPSYMNSLTFVVFILAGLLTAYIALSVMFPFYYMYGSIEKQEEEKQQAFPTPTPNT